MPADEAKTSPPSAAAPPTITRLVIRLHAGGIGAASALYVLEEDGSVGSAAPSRRRQGPPGTEALKLRLFAQAIPSRTVNFLISKDAADFAKQRDQRGTGCIGKVREQPLAGGSGGGGNRSSSDPQAWFTVFQLRADGWPYRRTRAIVGVYHNCLHVAIPTKLWQAKLVGHASAEGAEHNSGREKGAPHSTGHGRKDSDRDHKECLRAFRRVLVQGACSSTKILANSSACHTDKIASPVLRTL